VIGLNQDSRFRRIAEAVPSETILIWQSGRQSSARINGVQHRHNKEFSQTLARAAVVKCC